MKYYTVRFWRAQPRQSLKKDRFPKSGTKFIGVVSLFEGTFHRLGTTTQPRVRLVSKGIPKEYKNDDSMTSVRVPTTGEALLVSTNPPLLVDEDLVSLYGTRSRHECPTRPSTCEEAEHHALQTVDVAVFDRASFARSPLAAVIKYQHEQRQSLSLYHP